MISQSPIHLGKLILRITSLVTLSLPPAPLLPQIRQKSTLIFLANHTTPKAITISDVKQHTCKGPTFQTVMTALRNNSWSSLLATPDQSTNSNHLQAFYKIRNAPSASDHNDLLLRSHHFVLSSVLRSRALPA